MLSMAKKDVNFKSIAVTSVRFGHQSLALRRSRNARCFSAGVIAFPFAAGRPRFLVTGVIAVGDLVTLATGLVTLLVTLSVFASAGSPRRRAAGVADRRIVGAERTDPAVAAGDHAVRRRGDFAKRHRLY